MPELLRARVGNSIAAVISLSDLRKFLFRFLLLVVASYGALYFSYKWYAPGHFDFQTYYAPMYQRPLDFHAANPSHVFRQGTALLTYLLRAAGAYYPAKIAYAHPGIGQRLFFAALLANYLGLILASTLAGSIVERNGTHGTAPLLAGLLCIASFATQSFVLTGATAGLTWAFMALIYLLMLSRSRWCLGLALLLSIFQRELIVVVFAVLSLFQLLTKPRDRASARFVLVVSLLCFGLYVGVRQLAPEPDLSHQFSFAHLVANLQDVPTGVTLVFQSLLSQNVPILCLITGAVLWLDKKPVPGNLAVLFATFAVLIVLAVAEGEGAGDVGRIGAMLTPLFAAAAADGIVRALDRTPAPAG